MLVGVAVVLLYSAHMLSAFAAKTDTDLRTLRTSYVAASHEAASNKVIDESKNAVVDCQNRPRFEDLLTRLRTITEKERTELDTTFPACAPYQLSLKRFHLARLEHIIEKYNDILTYRTFFIKNGKSETDITAAMKAYLEKESARADLMAAQLQLQRDIIDVLHDKKIASGKSVDALAQNGAALNGKFIALQSEIEQVQKRLSDLLGQ
jgi:hypothetical protein